MSSEDKKLYAKKQNDLKHECIALDETEEGNGKYYNYPISNEIDQKGVYLDHQDTLLSKSTPKGNNSNLQETKPKKEMTTNCKAAICMVFLSVFVILFALGAIFLILGFATGDRTVYSMTNLVLCSIAETIVTGGLGTSIFY